MQTRADVAEAADLLDQPRQPVKAHQKQHQIAEDREDVARLDGRKVARSEQNGDDRSQNETFHQTKVDGFGVGKFDPPASDFVEVVSDVDLILRMNDVDFFFEFVVEASAEATCPFRIVTA